MLPAQKEAEIYRVSEDGHIYSQTLSEISTPGDWTQASRGGAKSVAITGDVIYMVGEDQRIYKQILNEMTPCSDWTVASREGVKSIAVNLDSIYMVGDDTKIYKQELSAMTPSTKWVEAGKGQVISIAMHGDTIYGVGVKNDIWKQTLSAMTPCSDWTLAGKGNVISIAIDGDSIYGVGTSNDIWKQRLSTMTPSTAWTWVSKAKAVAVAIKQQPPPCEPQPDECPCAKSLRPVPLAPSASLFALHRKLLRSARQGPVVSAAAQPSQSFQDEIGELAATARQKTGEAPAPAEAGSATSAPSSTQKKKGIDIGDLAARLRKAKQKAGIVEAPTAEGSAVTGGQMPPKEVLKAAAEAQDELVDAIERAMQAECRRISASLLGSSPGLVAAFLATFDEYAKGHCYRAEHPLTHLAEHDAAGEEHLELLQGKSALPGCVGSPLEAGASEPPSTDLLDQAAFDSQDALIDALDRAQATEVRRVAGRALAQMRELSAKEASEASARIAGALEVGGGTRHWRKANPIRRWRWEWKPVPTSIL